MVTSTCNMSSLSCKLCLLIVQILAPAASSSSDVAVVMELHAHVYATSTSSSGNGSSTAAGKQPGSPDSYLIGKLSIPGSAFPSTADKLGIPVILNKLPLATSATNAVKSLTASLEMIPWSMTTYMTDIQKRLGATAAGTSVWQ